MDVKKRINLALSLLMKERSVEQQRQGVAQLAKIMSVDHDHSMQVAGAGVMEPSASVLTHGPSELKADAAQLAARLVRDHESCRTPVITASIVPIFVDLLADGKIQQSRYAMSVLSDLCKSTAAQDVIAGAGAITPMVHMLEAGTPEQKFVSAGALSRLASPIPGSDLQPSHGNTHAVVIAKAGAIPLVLRMIAGGSEREQTNGLVLLERLCLNDSNANATVEAGGLKLVVALLKSGGPRQTARAAALLSLFAKREDHKASILKAGVAKVIVKLMSSGSDMQKTNCIALLNALLCEFEVDADHEGLVLSNDAHARFVQAGALKPLLRFLEIGTHEQKVNAAWAFNRLAIVEQHAISIAKQGAAESLLNLALRGDFKQSEAAVAAIEVLAWHRSSREALAAVGALDAMTRLLSHEAAGVQTHAVGALAEFATDDKLHRAMITLNALPLLMDMVSCGDGLLAAKAMRVLKYISEVEDASDVMRQGEFVSNVVRFLTSGTDLHKEFATSLLLGLVANEECALSVLSASVLAALLGLTRHKSKWQAKAASALLCTLCRHDACRASMKELCATCSFICAMTESVVEGVRCNIAQLLCLLIDEKSRSEIQRALEEVGCGNMLRGGAFQAGECVRCLLRRSGVLGTERLWTPDCMSQVPDEAPA